MANHFRNVNILAEVNANSSHEIVNIYQPGLVNAGSGTGSHTGVPFSGFITSLRLTVNIVSLNELIIPPSTFTQPASITETMERELILTSPKKCLSLFLKKPDILPILIGDIYLFNRRPYYFIGLLKYFSDALTFDVAPNTTIGIQQKDVGNGFLAGNDKLIIIGAGIEEAPSDSSTPVTFVPAPNPTPTPIPAPNPTPTPIDTEMANWLIKTSDYTAAIEEKILFLFSDSTTLNATLTLPSNPLPGNEIKLLMSYFEYNSPYITFNLNGKPYQGDTSSAVSFNEINRAVSLIFINNIIGWTAIPNVLYVNSPT